MKGMGWAVALAVAAGAASGAWLAAKNSGSSVSFSRMGARMARTAGAGRSPASIDKTALQQQGSISQPLGLAAVEAGESPTHSDFAKLVERNGLEKRARLVEGVVPPTRFGRALGRAIVLDRLRHLSGSEEAKMFRAQIHELEAHPEETASAISYSLERVPPELSRERREMIGFIRNLSIAEEKKMEIFSSELRKPAPRTGDPEKDLAAFANAAALESIIDLNSNRPEVVERELQDALAAHKDNREFQSLLIYTYAGMDESRAIELRKKMGL